MNLSLTNQLPVATFLLGALFAVPATAQNLTQFTNGTVADANAVNSNFTQLKNSVTAAAAAATAANDAATAAAAAAAQAGGAAATADGRVTTLQASFDAIFPNVIKVLGTNVGIGQSNPTAKLHINGAVKVDAANVVEFGAGVSGKQADAGKVGYGAFSSGVGLGLDIVGAGSTGANRRINLYNEGGANFTGPIQMRGASAVADLNINQSTGIGPAQGTAGIDLRNGVYRWRIYNSSNYVRFNNSSDDGANYTPLGYLSDTGVFTTVSDRRLKHDIEPHGAVLDDLMRVNIVDYKLNSRPATAPASIGVVAQELQAVFPQLVSSEEEGDLLAVNYAGLGVIAVKAIQEQQGTILALGAKSSELEGKVAALQKENESLRARLDSLESLRDEIATLKASLAAGHTAK